MQQAARMSYDEINAANARIGLSPMPREHYDENAARNEQLSQAITSSKIGEDGTIYRGVALTKEALSQYKVGAEVSDKGFFSASHSQEVAQKFAKKSADSFGSNPAMGIERRAKVLFKVEVSKGDAVLTVGHHLDSANAKVEQEAIMNAGTRFEVVSVSKNKSFHEVTLRVKR